MNTLVPLFLSLAIPNASAETLGLIPIQGEVTTDSGAPLEGVHPLTFRVWSGGASPIWTEQIQVQVTGGRFGTALGTATALDVELLGVAGALALTVQVGTGAESSPVPIAWTPRAAYAVRSGRADLATSATNALDADHADLADNATALGGLASGSWMRKADLGAGSGLALTATTLSVDLAAASRLSLSGGKLAVDLSSFSNLQTLGASCANGQVPKYVAASQSWSCANDNDGASGGAVVLAQDSGSTCSAQGAISFDPAGKRLRLCVDGAWQPIQSARSVVLVSGARRWSDGAYATSCETYRRPINAGENYMGSTGDGVYTIDPDGQGSGAPYNVWCDQTTENGGWTLLMRAAGTTFEYNSSAWTTSNVVNEADVSNAHNVSSKYASFNNLTVSHLLLRGDSGLNTVLALPSASTLLARTSSASTTILTYVSGADEPGKLINNKDWTYCGSPWRINTKGSFAAQIRLGGWVLNQWNCTYGADAAGESTGAHLLGFGLRDDQWSPYVYNAKSFGVRDAHDGNYLNPGQLAASGHIYGR